MKNKIQLISGFLLALTLVFSSCKDWLEVEPKSQIKDDELFSTAAGFKEALAGVYSTLVTNSLYTNQLRFGMMGVLAHEWTGFSTSNYPEAEDYDYTNSYPKGRIASFWSGMYSAIANANVILEVIDDKKSLFSENYYEIIKGEALALRAFVHFDLLRCFGVSYAVNQNMPAIPYVTLYTPLQSQQRTVSEIVELVLQDLQAAAELLTVDPIYTGEVITEFDDNGYLMNRQLHLNYYAVKGLMARVYLYKRDYTNAAASAREVINSGQFTWVSQDDMISRLDPSGATEQLWGIDVNNLSNISTSYFSPDDRNTSAFSLDATTRSLYYDHLTTDYRYLYLFVQGDGSNSESWYQQKCAGASSTSTGSAYYNNKMSMIKLAEMYFILAECLYTTGGDWLEVINEVRDFRGVPEITTEQGEASDLSTLLISEFRKEFLGEGQLFFFYKRLNIERIYGLGSDVNLVDLKAYTFPLPDSEQEAADRKENR